MLLPLVLAVSHTLFGHVVEQQTGRSLLYCDGRIVDLERLAATDSSGVFALPDVPPGTHELVVSCPFHETRTIRFERGTAAHDTLQLALFRTHPPPFEEVRRPDPTPFPPTPYGRLMVQAVDETGHPQQGLSVWAYPPIQQALTDSLGRCSFSHVTLGKTIVDASSPIHIAVRDTVVITENRTSRLNFVARLRPDLGHDELRLGRQGEALRKVDGKWQPFVYREPYRTTVIKH